MSDLSLPLTKFRVATKFNEVYLKNSTRSAIQQEELLEFSTTPLFFGLIHYIGKRIVSRHEGVWGLPIEHLLNTTGFSTQLQRPVMK